MSKSYQKLSNLTTRTVWRISIALTVTLILTYHLFCDNIYLWYKVQLKTPIFSWVQKYLNITLEKDIVHKQHIQQSLVCSMISISWSCIFIENFRWFENVLTELGDKNFQKSVNSSANSLKTQLWKISIILKIAQERSFLRFSLYFIRCNFGTNFS